MLCDSLIAVAKVLFISDHSPIIHAQRCYTDIGLKHCARKHSTCSNKAHSIAKCTKMQKNCGFSKENKTCKLCNHQADQPVHRLFSEQPTGHDMMQGHKHLKIIDWSDGEWKFVPAFVDRKNHSWLHPERKFVCFPYQWLHQFYSQDFCAHRTWVFLSNH